MVKKMLIAWLCLLIILACWLGAESFFTLPTDAQRIPANLLQEECCQLYGELLRLSFRVNRILNDIQETTLNNAHHIIDNYMINDVSPRHYCRIRAYINRNYEFKKQLEAVCNTLEEYLYWNHEACKESLSLDNYQHISAVSGVPIT